MIIKKLSNQQNQKNAITGTVLDPDNIPIAGVSVYVKGTTIGTYTDADGKYSLSSANIQPNSVFVFSSIGYQTVEYPFFQSST